MAGIAKTVQLDPRGPGHFLSGGNDYQRDNEDITLKASQGALKAGTILGRQETGTPTVTASAAVSGSGGTVGNGAVGTWTADAGASEGKWRLHFTAETTDLGKFEVIRPDGTLDGVGTVGTAYNGGINGTLADGSADWKEDDYVEIDVSYDGDDRVTVWGKVDLAATDGRQIARSILWDDRDDSASTQKATGTMRNTAVNGNSLVYPTGATTAQKALIDQQLKDVGIIVNW